MSFNIVFMGTSDFAREILEHLYLKKNFNIKAVYTQPPRKSERGQKINPSAVHKFADEKKIKIFCPSKLSDSDVQNIKKIKPDNLIVVSYGLILPLKVIEIPSCGAINVHTSMLPRWRGAAPIHRSIINGDKTTGVSIMNIEEGLDEGSTYMQSEINIGKNDTFEVVYNNLVDVSKATLDRFFSTESHLVPTRQDHRIATYAKKIKKSEMQINFEDDVNLAHNKIRAFSPKPGAWFLFNSKKYKIFKSELISEDQIDNYKKKKNLILKFKNGFLLAKNMQKEGKKIMSVQDFERGQPNELKAIRKKLS